MNVLSEFCNNVMNEMNVLNEFLYSTLWYKNCLKMSYKEDFEDWNPSTTQAFTTQHDAHSN